MRRYRSRKPAAPLAGQERPGAVSRLVSQMGNQATLAWLEQLQAQDPPPAYDGGQALEKAMQARMERQFGLSLADVRVHRDSEEPAKFDAGAYTYGTDIFIGPGQEDTLEHELTHVAQQKLGQVRPTGQEHGLPVNRDPALEHSADLGTVSPMAGGATGPVVQCAEPEERRNLHVSEDEDLAYATEDDEREIPSYEQDLTAFSAWREMILANSGLRVALQLFTGRGAMRGASASLNGIGSIYFGGTSTHHIFTDEEHTGLRSGAMPPHLGEMLRTSENGGRLRLLHRHGPKVSFNPRTLRGRTRRGGLYELLGDGRNFHTHRSRGQLIPRRYIPPLTTQQIEDLTYAVAYAQNLVGSASRTRQDEAIHHANSFVAHYVSQHLPDLYSLLNTQDVALDYYDSAPEQRRRA